MAYQHILMYGPQYAWFAGSLGAACAMLYPHTLGLQQYRDLITSQTHGKPDVVDTEVLLLAEQIKKDLKWRTQPFLPGTLLNLTQTSYFEFCNRGSTNTRWGGLIGVPAFFSTNSLRTAQENPQSLLKYNIDLETEKGKKIFDTFKLSPAAKKFALAREMCYAKSKKIFVDSCGLSFTVLGSYLLASTLSQQLRFRAAKMLSYITVIPALALVALKASDNYNCSLEAKVDKQVAKVSWDVAQGGVEYYTALIDRRQALEEAQSKLYNNAGITAVSDRAWRKPELSLAERRSRLQEECKKLYPEVEALPG